MIVLAGADLILPDRIVSRGTLVLDGGRIVEVREGEVPSGGVEHLRFDDHYIAPGFIDVHVHGVEGCDTLDERGEDPIAAIASRLPRYGVTAFCPTTVACAPGALRRVLASIRRARTSTRRGARVLPAHLESNFINPEYKGAQPLACLRLPPRAGRDSAGDATSGGFTGADILDEIAAARPDVGIVTLAPELPGGIDLVRDLVAAGHRVALGHSGADYDQALAAIAAGARHATHLFNRMPPLAHRAPGLAGAVLAHDELAAEIICDGYHVHPAIVRAAIAAKSPSRVMAITDGTAGSGMPAGTRARLGGQPITVTDRAALLDDGTLAGSVLTMDRAFRTLIGAVGLSPVDAARLCATTAARELGLTGLGVIADGATADLVVLDRGFDVVQTYIGGVRVYG